MQDQSLALLCSAQTHTARNWPIGTPDSTVHARTSAGFGQSTRLAPRFPSELLLASVLFMAVCGLCERDSTPEIYTLHLGQGAEHAGVLAWRVCREGGTQAQAGGRAAAANQAQRRQRAGRELRRCRRACGGEPRGTSAKGPRQC